MVLSQLFEWFFGSFKKYIAPQSKLKGKEISQGYEPIVNGILELIDNIVTVSDDINQEKEILKSVFEHFYQVLDKLKESKNLEL